MTAHVVAAAASFSNSALPHVLTLPNVSDWDDAQVPVSRARDFSFDAKRADTIQIRSSDGDFCLVNKMRLSVLSEVFRFIAHQSADCQSNLLIMRQVHVRGLLR